MFFEALARVSACTLEYREIGSFDDVPPDGYDFYVFNHHHETMPWLDTRRLGELPGRKLALVLAMRPESPLAPGARTVDWDAAQPSDVKPAQLLKDPPVDAPFLPLPPAAMRLTSFTRWAKNFDRWLARTQRLDATTKSDPPEQVSLPPTRGGVSVELVAIVWVLE